MKVRSQQSASATAGFTLVETVVALGILGLVFEGAILGYVRFSQQAEWSAHALAAQSIASQGAEQARAARWDTQAWPQGVGPGQSDELGETQYIRVNTLDLPANGGLPITVTNYVSVTSVSASPNLRQIRSDCVWSFPNRGWFTNSVIFFRAPDQ